MMTEKEMKGRIAQLEKIQAQYGTISGLRIRTARLEAEITTLRADQPREVTPGDPLPH
jgi:hypothetical protein